MKRFGISTTSLAAAALALPAQASLPPASESFDLELFSYTEPAPPSRDQLIQSFWEQYQSQVTKCIIPAGTPNEVSLVQSPEIGLNITATCDGYLDYNTETYNQMMATGELIMQSTSIQCGYITMQAGKNHDIQVISRTFDGVPDCAKPLEKAFPGYSFSDYEHMDPEPENFNPEMCKDTNHNDEEIADLCWQLRGPLD